MAQAGCLQRDAEMGHYVEADLDDLGIHVVGEHLVVDS